MAYYGGPGPLTTLLNTAIRAGGGLLGEFVGQKLLRKRLEDMFATQTETGTALKMLEGRDPEEYQKIAPVIEQQLQGRGLFKTGLPKITEQIGSYLPTNGEIVTSAEQLKPYNKTTYIQPKENIKDLISREGTKWFGELPAKEKSAVLKAAIAPKDLSSMIAMMGLQQRDTAQEDTRQYREGILKHKEGQQQLSQANLALQIQKLQEQINKTATTNRRLTSLEDLASHNILKKLTDDMSLLLKSGDIEGAKWTMNQANDLIRKHPNLGIEPFQMEEGRKIPGLGWEIGKKSITGGKAKARPTSLAPSEPTNFPDPTKLPEGQTGTDTTTGKRYKVTKGRWTEIQ